MTYLELMPAFLALALVPVALLAGTPREAPRRRWAAMGLALAVLIVLTVIFDSLMIAAGFFSYGDGSLTGITLWLAPVEDLAYVLAAVVLLPVLWWALGHRGHVSRCLRTWLATSRPISWVNTAYPFATAYWLLTHSVDAILIVGSLFFLIPYNLMMYGINDVFDYESDLRNPRKGGVEGALADRSEHRGILAAAVLLPLPFVLFLWAAGSPASGIVLAVSLFAVLAYSVKGLRFKEIPFLDSATSATHFVSPMVFAFAVAGAQWTATLTAVTAAFFLWGMASQAFGAVQDIRADRAGGLASIGTVLGARRTVLASAILYVVAGLSLLPAQWPVPVAALFVLPYLANLVPFLTIRDDDCERANTGWKRFLWINYLVGFAVTMLMIRSLLPA
ncbi:prenyltransferase [Kocuria coralli]|uniref:Prenyltransferase n=1 Tax=Kocuria coralli TaxID=1461025 RepID=A0A5J5KZM8_9MICC|nr:prenyltransferase [Kocuria coralli]KAA9395042.1 prenyltransferase [Kocuria coralli]